MGEFNLDPAVDDGQEEFLPLPRPPRFRRFATAQRALRYGVSGEGAPATLDYWLKTIKPMTPAVKRWLISEAKRAARKTTQQAKQQMAAVRELERFAARLARGR